MGKSLLIFCVLLNTFRELGRRETSPHWTLIDLQFIPQEYWKLTLTPGFLFSLSLCLSDMIMWWRHYCFKFIGLICSLKSSEIPIPRNVSCPVSPIGSPLLHSRSPQHINGRMSPSPISSPRNASGASTPLTGGSGAIPFNHSKQSINLQEGFGSMPKPLTSLYVNGPSYHDPSLDIFRSMQPGSHAFSELVTSENDVLGMQFARLAHAEHDGQTVLADRVSRQLLRDDVALSPSLDLSSSSSLPSRTHCV